MTTNLMLCAFGFLAGVILGLFMLLAGFSESWQCKHDWQEMYRVKIIDPETGEYWHKIILTCKKCGKIKKIKL